MSEAWRRAPQLTVRDIISLPLKFGECRRDVADMILVEQLPGVFFRESRRFCRFRQGLAFRDLAAHVIGDGRKIALLGLERLRPRHRLRPMPGNDAVSY